MPQWCGHLLPLHTIEVAQFLEGVVDLSHLVGTGVFSAWEDPAQFEAVEVAEFGAPEWPGGIDLCPDSLYMQITGKNLEEIQEDSRAALSA